MTGSEFQELWRYVRTLEQRISTLEAMVNGLPEILTLTEAQKDQLAQIAWDSEAGKTN